MNAAAFALLLVLAAPAAPDPPPTPPPTPAGACDNPADQSRLAARYRTLDGTARECAFDCLTDDEGCAARCVRRETGLSVECAACFGTLVECTTANCALRCVISSSDMCRDCRAEYCEAAFEACAGVEIRR